MKRTGSGSSSKKDQTPPQWTFSVGNRIQSSAPRLKPFNKDVTEETLIDTLCFLIVCRTHKKVAIAVGTKRTALWLPFIHVLPTTSWRKAITEGVALILGEQDKKITERLKNLSQPKLVYDNKILEVSQFQLPKTLRIINRVICLISLKNIGKISQNMCPNHRNSESIEWFDMDKVTQTNFWGPEVAHSLRKYERWISDSKKVPRYQEEKEFLSDDIFRYYGRSPAKNMEEYLLSGLKINEGVVERLFTDYFEHCFPSFYMTKISFVEYLCKYGFERNEKKLNNLFNAFNYLSTGYLSFHEVLLGIAFIDPKIQHMESRFKFVFRYYDCDRNGFLSEKEFRALIKDMLRTDSDNVIDQRVKEQMRKMNATAKGVDYEAFRRSVAHKDQNFRFQGTSSLCRASTQLFSVIQGALLDRYKDMTKQKELKITIAEYLKQKSYSGNCDQCRKQEVELSLHMIRLYAPRSASDALYRGAHEINEIKSIAGKKSRDRYSIKYQSDVTFNNASLANVLRAKIKEFNRVKGTRDDPKGFMADSNTKREEFHKMLISFCKDLTPIFESEGRCLRISSPVIIIGDIHGNLEDLFSIENCLFKSFPLVAKDYLFLGDYVDRGKWSLECVVYILCLKALAPNHVFLLRGNHETRLLQRTYGFYKECINKYDSLGEDIWELLNGLFDRLPLAAIIDSSIVCCHGGIPSFGSIADIDKAKTEIKDLEEFNLGWELVWNDPVNDDTLKDAAKLQNIDNRNKLFDRGFVPNKRRGTGYFFDARATDQFLKANGLTHMVRAHEVPKWGYAMWFDFKLITVFSHSHYSGTDNKAAVIEVFDEWLRVTTLDTVNNAPATDDLHRNNK